MGQATTPPEGHDSEDRQGGQGQAEQKPGALGGPAATEGTPGGHNEGDEDPGQNPGHLPGDVGQHLVDPEPLGQTPPRLEGQGNPVVLGIPDQGWRDDDQCNQRPQPGCRVAQEGPPLGQGEEKHHQPQGKKDGMVLGEARQAEPKAGQGPGQPRRGRRSLRGRASRMNGISRCHRACENPGGRGIVGLIHLGRVAPADRPRRSGRNHRVRGEG